jgi:tRNA U34 5-methylaminomethyl-2-thiouridine-forming methyltransferase MnmC
VKSEIKITRDGSSTLFVPELNEHFHSINGAVQESKHVYIDMGFNTVRRKDIRIFELGFGTGLNALLTAMNSIQRTVIYHAIELHPLSWAIVKKLGYQDFLDLSDDERSFFKSMHEVQWEQEILVRSDYLLMKINASIIEYALTGFYDLVFFDAFAPDMQPELWEEPVFLKLYESMNAGGRLVTYCAKGEVRRRMQRVGFVVERLPGSPGKREMLRGTKPLS